MASADSPAQSVLDALGFVLFARDESGAMRLLGEAPGWLRTLWPELQQTGQHLPLAAASPFLENFLIDAAACWEKGGAECAKSGPWVEQDGEGAEIQLEATALTAAGQALLLLERLGDAFEAKKLVLQRARETVIAHQRLNSEVQKKEILLHCVADEMTGALANIITALRLIEQEDNGPRTKLLLGLASRASEEQQTLIHRILAVFEDELRDVCGANGATESVTDWDTSVRRVLASAAPLFAEKGIALDAPAPRPRPIQIQLPAEQLERVLLNLLENALERSPARGAVALRSAEEPESLLVSVEDHGPLLSPEDCENLFARFDPSHKTPAAALRLHFCRIVLENAGDEIGSAPLSAGGNHFWIRLTKSEATP